jgi:hypothetical protein
MTLWAMVVAGLRLARLDRLPVDAGIIRAAMLVAWATFGLLTDRAA